MISSQAIDLPHGAGAGVLRFIAPVPVGSRIRGHFALVAAEGRPDGSVKTVTDVTIEIEGQDKPALTGQWLGVFYPPSTQRKLVA